MKNKIHYEMVTQEPNESDPDGWSEIACGRDCVEYASENIKAVTCKQCLNVIEKKRIAMINNSFCDSQGCY